jgi:hypothetical protein
MSLDHIADYQGFAISWDEQTGRVRVFRDSLGGWTEHIFDERARDRATAIAIAKAWILGRRR